MLVYCDGPDPEPELGELPPLPVPLPVLVPVPFPVPLAGGVVLDGWAGLLLPSIPGGNCTLSICGIFGLSGSVSPGFLREGGAVLAFSCPTEAALASPSLISR